jgi:3-oxoacyl-[acyl-carrier protein] reductase
VRDRGRIINISSSSVGLGLPGAAAYATSKSGALTTIAILARELGSRGVTANSVMVGPVGSGFLDPAGEVVASAPHGLIDNLASAAPRGRLGEPSDIAPIVAFLASPDPGWINGQTILANNGGTA